MTWGNLARPALRVARAWERTSSLDVLQWCNHRTATLYHYWESRRGGRLMPRRADIDPLEMRNWLGRMALIDVTSANDNGGARFRYRLVGTALTELRGSDPTGLAVEAAWPAEDAEIVLAAYRQVVAQKAPVFCHPARQLRRDQEPSIGVMLLPLSSDGETVDLILGYLSEGTGVLGLVI
jgi:hypothetical protein